MSITVTPTPHQDPDIIIWEALKQELLTQGYTLNDASETVILIETPTGRFTYYLHETNITLVHYPTETNNYEETHIDLNQPNSLDTFFQFIQDHTQCTPKKPTNPTPSPEPSSTA